MKTIVILSSEPWGKMMLSKMHFARELSDDGNKVFFVNPPRKEVKQGQERLADKKNLTIIHVREHPLRVLSREKFYPLFKWIEKRFVRNIKRITGNIDELWCFNPHFISDIDFFEAGKTLLLIYDLYRGKNLQIAAEKSDAIISVAQNILDEFKDVDKPKLLINHGLAPAFEKEALKSREAEKERPITRIGYVGNLLRGAIDIPVFTKLIEEHTGVEFHFWGPSGFSQNNVTGKTAPEELIEFNIFLQKRKNVVLHGVKTPEELATEIAKVDAFLFLYSADRDMNAASNSHKLIEYLSTGKPVFSSHVSTYKDKNLLIMPDASEADFVSFFRDEIKNITCHSEPDRAQHRVDFALNNTYSKQISRIRGFLKQADTHTEN